MRTEHRSLEIARLVDRLRSWDDKVVAFDLAGAETGFPPSLHAEALAFARCRTPEHHDPRQRATGPRADLRRAGPRRASHRPRRPAARRHEPRRSGRPRPSRRCVLGPLAQYVLDHQVHLEMAPTCNVQIGAVPERRRSPDRAVPAGRVQRRAEHRQPADEQRDAVERTPRRRRSPTTCTSAEMEQLAANAMMSSFAPMDVRRRIVADTDPARLPLTDIVPGTRDVRAATVTVRPRRGRGTREASTPADHRHRRGDRRVAACSSSGDEPRRRPNQSRRPGPDVAPTTQHRPPRRRPPRSTRRGTTIEQLNEYVAQAAAFDQAGADAQFPQGLTFAAGGAPGYSRYVFREHSEVSSRRSSRARSTEPFAARTRHSHARISS